MHPLPIIVIVVALTVAAVFGYLAYLSEKKRRVALAILAQEIGWRFDPLRDRHHDEEYAHFEIFRRGHGRAAYNTLRGSIELFHSPRPAKMGDFVYRVTSHSGKSSSTRTYRFSYLIVELAPGSVPDLLIRPEGVLDKLAGAFGLDDIDFESAEFSRKFYVKSPDKRFAYDVIHPRMMEFLLATSPPAVDIEASRCCLSDGRTRWKPEQFKQMLRWAEEYFGRWPDHLIDERAR